MEIKNRLFPYPVLNSYSDDYVDSEFDVKYNYEQDMTQFLFSFDMSLENNEELIWLIREGLAEYAIHIECSTTSYRTIIKTASKNISYNVLKSKLKNEVTILGCVVAKKDIKNYWSSHLNEDYTDETINFPKGAILAYKNLPKLFIVKNHEELAHEDPFFTIIKRNSAEKDERKPVVYDINDQKIKIIVDADIYTDYAKYKTNITLEPLITTLLVMPAIMYMIDVLREEGVERYSSYYWYKKIKQACHLQGKIFEEDFINQMNLTTIEIVQDMLQLPINRSFLSLSRLLEE